MASGDRELYLGADFRQVRRVCYYLRSLVLTTSDGTAPLLLRQLKQSNVTALKISLRGRPHCQYHHDDLDIITNFCDSDPDFQFPDTSRLPLPMHLSPDGKVVKELTLQHAVLRMILEEQSKWHQTFTYLQASILELKASVVVSSGPDRDVPPSLMRKLGPRLVYEADRNQAAPRIADSALDPAAASVHERYCSDNDIFVVGISC